MDRKFTIFIIILLLLAAGGVFWWWSTREKEPEEGETFYEIEFAKEYDCSDFSSQQEAQIFFESKVVHQMTIITQIETKMELLAKVYKAIDK